MFDLKEYLLGALKCGLKNESVSWNSSLTGTEWSELIKAAKIHDILPIVVEAVNGSTAFQSMEKKQQTSMIRRARSRTIYQAASTAEFQLLYLFLIERGLTPLVIKGVTLRQLYPQPEQRHSADEDILISPKDLRIYHRAMLDYGLRLVNPDEDIEIVHEVAYECKEKHLYIELHKTFFPPESSAYGNLNSLFEGVHVRTTTINICGQIFHTILPTDHFLYLICHAYKHFIHCGVGIRHVADIGMFAEHYAAQIDWEKVFALCKKVNIEVFAAALLKIAHKYLVLSDVPAPFSGIEVDEKPLLDDIITGGIYGAADADRAHSSNITLTAVAANRQGRKSTGLLRSVFPGKTYLQTRFPYAKKKPVLLPVAWGHRIIGYLKSSKTKNRNPSKSISIGHSRVKLLEQYKLLK